jgi:malate synthase
MPQPNQVDRQREDVNVTAAELLKPSEGTITEHGLRWNIKVGIQYLEAWLGGNGCVPLYNLMEDAATAEISRAQCWQWLRHNATLDDGRAVTRDLFEKLYAEELSAIRGEVGDERYERGKFGLASDLFASMCQSPEFVEFLTLPAYEYL